MLVELADPLRVGEPTLSEWNALFAAQDAPANPFCAPEWVLTWYRHFVTPAADRLLFLIRSGDGRLVGVAPFFLAHDHVGPAQVSTRMRLVGAGQGSSLLELPQVLCAPGQGRAVLAAVVQEFRENALARSGADWLELSIAEGQGWMEPQWFVRSGHPAAFWRHQDTRASVVLELQPAWEATRSGLKRNVTESLRRARNRLAKQHLPHEVVRRADDLDAACVDRFLQLHRSRANHQGSSVHPDAFADPARALFVKDLLPRLGAVGLASIWELWLGGRHVASQLILHAPGTVYVHSSGFDSSTWELSPIIHLQEHAFAFACEAGDRWVNMSPGPNVAKLRWSERLHRHDEFCVGFGDRTRLYRYAAVAGVQALRAVQHTADVAAQDA